MGEHTPINEKVSFGNGCCGPFLEWKAHPDERGGPEPLSDYNGCEPVWLGGSVAPEDLERLAACWNACRAIPTEQLAQPVYPAAVVQRLVEAAEGALQDGDDRNYAKGVLQSDTIEQLRAALAEVGRVGNNTQETQQ